MSNTSATGGYLSAAPVPAPDEDVALEDAFQSAIAGITGIDGMYVRPRWQPGNPKQPGPTINWVAIGVSKQTPDAMPSVEHSIEGNGKDKLKRHEDIDLACSFYGPASGHYAGILRDGFYESQNSETINQLAISFVDAGEARLVPELVNQQWIRRTDITLRFRRQIVREYAVLNIDAADIDLIDDTGQVDDTIVITPNP